MLISVLLVVLSPYTAFLPALYMVYKVLSKKVIIYKNPMNISLLILFIWSFLSGVVNHSVVSTVLSFAFFMYFCFSNYLQNYFDNEDKIEKLLRYIVFFSIFAAIFGIIEKISISLFNFTLWKNLLGLAGEPSALHRIYSTFGNPNVAGNWFAVMILICIYFNDNAAEKNKLFYKLSMLLFFITLCLAGSSGAIIGLITGLLVYNICRKNYRNLVLLVVFITVAVIISLLPVYVFGIRNVVKLEIHDSILSRTAVWAGCLKMLAVKPVTGWGLMGIYENGFNYIDYHTKVFHGHNIWITLLTTLGVVGLTIYLFMKLYLFKSLKDLFNYGCKLVPLFAAVQALIIGHGLVDFTIMTPQAGLIFMSCSSFISSLAMRYSNAFERHPVRKSPFKSLSKVGRY